ncbi:MAG: hypothetical protein PUE12_10645 [Oscillospiraceae bacterium]|nr:hypothetical protein [Oscillospiraceae bacterium]
MSSNINMRNSNIELLRIVCILMIITMHVFGLFRDIEDPIIVHSNVFINSFCNIAVTSFVLISGYYGVRTDYKKLLKYNVTITIYSIFFLIVFGNLDMGGGKNILRSVFPLFFNKYWFFTSYIILLSIANYLELIFNGVNKQEFQKLLFSILVFTVLAPSLLVTEIFNDNGKGFMNMLSIYMVGRYIRKYGFPAIILSYPFTVLILTFITGFGLNEILNYFNLPLFFARDNNILILIMALCFFYLFIKRKPLHNVFFNTIASYVLYIYVIHIEIMNYNLWNCVYFDYLPIIINIFFIIIFLFVVSIAIEYIRRFLVNKLWKL